MVSGLINTLVGDLLRLDEHTVRARIAGQLGWTTLMVRINYNLQTKKKSWQMLVLLKRLANHLTLEFSGFGFCQKASRKLFLAPRVSQSVKSVN
jgi:hypothetical protein